MLSFPTKLPSSEVSEIIHNGCLAHDSILGLACSRTLTSVALDCTRNLLLTNDVASVHTEHGCSRRAGPISDARACMSARNSENVCVVDFVSDVNKCFLFEVFI